MIKNIVFDLDETLLDTKLVDSIVVDKLYRDFGVPRDITEKFYTLLKFQPFKDGVSSVAYRKYLWEFVTERKSNLGFHYYEWWENTRKIAIEESYNSCFLDNFIKEGFNVFIATSGDTYTQSMKLAHMNVNYPFFVFDRQNGFDKTNSLSWTIFFKIFGIGKDTLVVGNDFEQDIEIPHELKRKVILTYWYENTIVRDMKKLELLREREEIEEFNNYSEFFNYCLTLRK